MCAAKKKTNDTYLHYFKQITDSGAVLHYL